MEEIVNNYKTVFIKSLPKLILVTILPCIIYIVCISIGDKMTAPLIVYSFSDFMSFYGGYLSFVGTIFLGIVAIIQNQEANDISNRLLDMEMRKTNPVLSLLKFSIVKLDLNGNENDKLKNWFYIGDGKTGTKIGTVTFDILNVTGLVFTKCFAALKHPALKDSDESVTLIDFSDTSMVNATIDLVLEHDEGEFKTESDKFAKAIKNKPFDTWYLMLGVEGLTGKKIYSYYRLTFIYREVADKVFEATCLGINPNDDIKAFFESNINVTNTL